MLRQSLDTDSPFVHLVIHGNGMPGMQFRSVQGGDVQHVRFADRRSRDVHAEAGAAGHGDHGMGGKDNGPLRERGSTQNQLGSPVLVGLGVASHTQTATNTVLFSNVSVEGLTR